MEKNHDPKKSMVECLLLKFDTKQSFPLFGPKIQLTFEFLNIKKKSQ
jgi:hypothetical protein